MVRQLTKVGDQWAVLLDGQMLRDMAIDETTYLEIMPYGKSIMISRAPIEGEAPKDPILDKINRRYRHMFIRMAW